MSGKSLSDMTGDELRAAIAADVPGAAKAYAETHRVLCAHADDDGRPAHWLEPGEKCPDAAQPRPEAEVEAADDDLPGAEAELEAVDPEAGA